MITVLRLGHRKKRDARLSTHVGLVARAFGAQKIVFCGERDEKLLESLRCVAERWGGPFGVTYEANWRKTIKRFKGKKVHLTMYGLPLQKQIQEIRKHKNLLVIVGSEKVPGDVYGLVDYNVAVASQPHSEAAALAVFLHEYYKGAELTKKFKNAKLKIVPKPAGKCMVRR